MPIKLSSLGEIGVPRLNEIIVFRSNADALLYYKRPDSKIVPMSDLGKSGLYDFKETFVVNAIINKTGESSIILNLGTFTPKLMLFQEVTKVIGGGGGSASSSGGGGSGITGSGTTNYLAKFTSPSAIGDSKIFDNGTSVAIGNNAPTTSTAFEVKSTSGAILIPRMSTIQRNALTAIDGMILYDTTLPSFMGFAASTWYSFVGTSTTNTVNVIPKFATQSTLIDGSWAFSANDIIPLTANSNIGSASNYVGTIFLGSTLRYASNLIFSEAGTERGRWDGDKFGIGTNSPSSRLHIVGAGTTSATTSLKIQNSSLADMLSVINNGEVRIGTVIGSTSSLNIGYSGGQTLKFYSAFSSTPYTMGLEGNYDFWIRQNSGLQGKIAIDFSGSTSLTLYSSATNIKFWSSHNITHFSGGSNYAVNLEGDTSNQLTKGNSNVIISKYAGGGFYTRTYDPILSIFNGSFSTQSVGNIIGFKAYWYRNGFIGIGTTVNDAEVTAPLIGSLTVNQGTKTGYTTDNQSTALKLETPGSSTTVTFTNNPNSMPAQGLTVGTFITANSIKRRIISVGIGAVTVDSAVDWSAGYTFTYRNPYLSFRDGTTSIMHVDPDGLFGIGIDTPTAFLHIKAGTSSVPPSRLTSGTLCTGGNILPGNIEFLTDDYFLTGTTGTTRKTISDLVYRGISAARTLDGSDELVDCTSGTFAVTLPTAVGFTKQYIIKNSGTGVITLNTTSSQTIDGNASGTIILNQYDSKILRSNGNNWILV